MSCFGRLQGSKTEENINNVTYMTCHTHCGITKYTKMLFELDHIDDSYFNFKIRLLCLVNSRFIIVQTFQG